VVLFQRSKTRFENIGTYGKSPYPPAKSDLRMAPLEPEGQAKKQGPLGGLQYPPAMSHPRERTIRSVAGVMNGDTRRRGVAARKSAEVLG
jgi:hypothetical protein